MYNILLFLALLATLYATLPIINDDLLVNMTVPFILLSTTTIVVAVYAPSILKGKEQFYTIEKSNFNRIQVDSFYRFFQLDKHFL